MPTGKPITDELIEQITQLNSEGVQRKDIAAQVGVSEPTVRKVLEGAGYPPREGKYGDNELTDDQREQIVHMRNSGVSYGEIAKQVGIAKRTAMDVVRTEVARINGWVNNSVSAEEFIAVWQTCNTVDDAATRLKMNVKTVTQRAYAYRMKGVPLKPYPKGRQKYNWDDLAAFAVLFTDDET